MAKWAKFISVSPVYASDEWWKSERSLELSLTKYEIWICGIWKYAFARFLSRFEELLCWDNWWTALGLTNHPTQISDQTDYLSASSTKYSQMSTKYLQKTYQLPSQIKDANISFFFHQLQHWYMNKCKSKDSAFMILKSLYNFNISTIS